MKKINIHFVCRGNTYRSRLASAYTATLASNKYRTSSSGIGPRMSKVQTVNTYTKTVADHHVLTFDIDTPRTQTTNELLREADVIVFMNQDVYLDAAKRFIFDDRKSVVWDVADIEEYALQHGLPYNTDTQLLKIAERGFQKIRHLCDELYAYLSLTSWADITDEHNQLSGLRLPVNWAADKGLWRRSCHIVITTTDRKFLVEKRSKNIVFSPSMIDISLGGGVDAGETPLQAAVRETKEELGIELHPKDFRPLFIKKWSTYHPHYKKYTKTHSYVFHISIPLHSSDIQIQKSEVEKVLLLSERQVMRLLRTHYLKHIGRLVTGYAFYTRVIKQILLTN